MSLLYSYLNLESTKTNTKYELVCAPLYSYLNLESTKTRRYLDDGRICCTVT